MRRLFVATLALAAAPALAAQQLQPPSTGGLEALDRAITRLSGAARVMVIAAHPDDENNELLTYLSRGLGVRTAYLSLSRGEGGQNLIGEELGEGLGLVRTGELLAARSVDGGRQFFTRAYDFGFSKTLDETLALWPRDTLVADVLRVVRRFRPQVIIEVFSGTPRDGHGQHQASAVVARQVFELLRDSTWGPRKLYRSAFFDPAAATLTFPSGLLDPVTGRSYHQIAVASRSAHRSQDMGGLLDLGSFQVRLTLIEDLTGSATGGVAGAPLVGVDHLFDGIDVGLPSGLRRYGELIDSARTGLLARDPARIVPLLVAALDELRRAAPPAFRQDQEPQLSEAIAAAAGIVVDASAGDGRIVGGQVVPVTVRIWNAGAAALAVRRAGLLAPAGWQVRQTAGAAGMVAPGGLVLDSFQLEPPADAPLSEPYFLVRPRRGALYDWSAVPDSLRGEPFGPPPIVAEIELDLAGRTLAIRREVSQRFNDQARGEVRRPLFVVPAVGVAVDPEVMVWPTASQAPRTVTVELIHGARGRTEGELRLEVPGGWPDVPPQRFVLEGEDTRRSFTFEVRAPRGLRPGATEIHAVALVNGARYERASVLVDYPHIRPVMYTKDATIRVVAAEIALPPLRRVGYVRGASDMVPEALQAVGVPVAVLSETDLERGDLAQYDAIVIGSRAYETDSALIANNARLLDYARAGGRLIVQYQQYQFVTGRFAPYELSIARPHDRVTDENAPVHILEPTHPLVQTPNRIGEADWQGWVQERGLYFAHDWDPAYHPLLEMGDNGERLQGGLLVSRLGRGLYVYTGISFFRQLPAGVPGAYRLFMNLLGLTPANVP